MEGVLSPKASVAYKPEPGNQAPAINDDEVPVALRLSIPQELYAEYERAATNLGLTVTELIMHRLNHCRDHNSRRSLYFTDSQRGALETLLQKRPLETAEQALSLITVALSVKVGELPMIPLTPQQIKRISMGGYASQTPEQRLVQIIQGAISKAYGV